MRNVRCHACDGRTDEQWKVEQYSVRAESAIIGIKKGVVFWPFAKPVHLCYDRGSKQIAYIPFVCFNQSSNTTTAFFPDVSCMAGLQLPIFKCLLTVQFTNRPLPSVFVCC